MTCENNFSSHARGHLAVRPRAPRGVARVPERHGHRALRPARSSTTRTTTPTTNLIHPPTSQAWETTTPITLRPGKPNPGSPTGRGATGRRERSARTEASNTQRTQAPLQGPRRISRRAHPPGGVDRAGRDAQRRRLGDGRCRLGQSSRLRRHHQSDVRLDQGCCGHLEVRQVTAPAKRRRSAVTADRRRHDGVVALLAEVLDGTTNLRGAACAEHPKLFDLDVPHAEVGHTSPRERWSAVKATCQRCPVRGECWQWATGLRNSTRRPAGPLATTDASPWKGTGRPRRRAQERIEAPETPRNAPKRSRGARARIRPSINRRRR